MPNDEDTLAHPEQPRFLLPSWMWAVMLFVFFGMIVAIAFGAMSRSSTYEEDRAKTRAEKLRTAQEEWNKTAESYGWVDKNKGVAHIPIQRAVELEVSDLQTKKPQPAGPIATATPAATPEGASPPANPPVAKPAASPGSTASSVEGPNSEARGQPAAAANPPNAGSGTHAWRERHSSRRPQVAIRRASFSDKCSEFETSEKTRAARRRLTVGQ